MKTTAKSKWRRIYEDLLAAIKDGRYSTGKFPSETQLAKKYVCGRLTVQAALDKLESEGLIVRRAGSGTQLTRKARNACGRLGLIMPSLSFGEIFPLIAQSLTREAAKDGYQFMLGDISSAKPEDRAHEACKVARQFIEQGVAGVIVQPLAFLKSPDRVTREILRLFAEMEIPTLLIDRDVDMRDVAARHDFVAIDNLSAGRALGDHLLEAGAKRIAFLMRPECASVIRDRQDGVASALSRRGRKLSVIVAEPTDTAAFAGWFKGKKAYPDAVICESDQVAALFANTLRKFKLRIPEDVSLAGFDDVTYAKKMIPPLTTVRQPCEDLAVQAYRTLRERMHTPDLPSRRILLPASLVVRESTGYVKKC